MDRPYRKSPFQGTPGSVADQLNPEAAAIAMNCHHDDPSCTSVAPMLGHGDCSFSLCLWSDRLRFLSHGGPLHQSLPSDVKSVIHSMRSWRRNLATSSASRRAE